MALESTLIAHGLPRPDNLGLGIELESIVRAEGGVPATVGVIHGVPTIGLSETELEQIATVDEVAKLSVRDLAPAVALKRVGATTVASTAFLASCAGVRMFATGGLGGVHRGARESWDESADLVGLSRAPIGVVCAGVKSILDVGATLERLETLGVTVIGFRTRRFPGFYLADSGHGLEWSMNTPAAAAAVLDAELDLRRSAVVVANPLPHDQQLDPVLHERVLAAGLAEVERRGLHGKAITPFLLEFFCAETGGQSLRVNLELVRHNARLATQIAHELALLRRSS